MYKSIIFDIGGVLVDFDPKAYFCLLYTSPSPRDCS